MANRVNIDLDLNVQGYVEGLGQAADSTQKYETEVRKIKDSTVNFNKEFREAKKTVRDLAASYAALDKETKRSQFGREMASQLEEAKKKAAEYIDLQGDLQAELKNLASDTHTLDMLSEGMGVFADATSGALGIIAQFTGNEEDAQKAIVAFTTAQSALGMVTKLQNALQMQSNTMMAVSRVQTLAATAAINIKTAAEGKGVIVTKAATVAQALFNKVANANPYVLLATSIIAVTSALASFIVFSGKSAAEQEHQNRMTERAKTITDAYYDGLNNSLEETIPKYIRLQTEWANLRTEAEKIQWIKDNQDEFNALGVEVNNVNDAENLLVNQTENVMNAFLQRAKAIGASTQAAQLYSQALEDIQWLEEHRNDTTLKSDELAEHGFDTSRARIHHHGGALGLGHARYELLDVDAMIRERQKNAEDKIKQLYEDMGRFQAEGEKQLTDAGIKAIKEGDKKKNKARTSSKNDTKKVIHENSLEEAEELVKTWEEALKQADINDTELIARINQEIAKAKKEVERRKMILGIDVKVNITPGSSKDFDNQIKALKEKQEKTALGSAEWYDIQDMIERLETAKKIMTEGITKTGKADLAKAFGDVKTYDEISNAISTLENHLRSVDWSKMGEDGARTFQQYIDRIQELKALLEPMNKTWEESMMTPLEKAQKKLEKTSETISSIGNALQAAGDMFSALGEAADDQGLEVTGIIAKAVATVALSYAQALTTAKTWVDWLAFGLTGMGTMISMINQIKSATSGYAGGGIVEGSSYSGDRIMARVNSGEMILNRRQQTNLFNWLDSDYMPKRGGSNVTVTGVIRGKDLLLVQKNANSLLGTAGQNISF